MVSKSSKQYSPAEFFEKEVDLDLFFSKIVNDCGPVCLGIISKYYGKHYDIDYVRSLCQKNMDGVTLLALDNAAECLGLKTMSIKISLRKLMEYVSLPCIIFCDKNHFAILYKIQDNLFYILSPGTGLIVLDIHAFKAIWLDDSGKGVSLIMEDSAS